MTRRATALLAVAVATGGLAITALPSARATSSATVEVYPATPSGDFTLHGRGYGHGHGMSQWGAYGAASVRHLTGAQIVHFYYPHTKLVARTGVGAIRVDLSAAQSFDTGYLQVAPAKGMTVTWGTTTYPLPTERRKHAVTAWRLVKVSAKVLQLKARAGGAWHRMRQPGAVATFHDTAASIPVVVPGGQTRAYRGRVTAELESGVVETVNTVSMTSYLKSVVPMEMPASWSAAALQAQAIAARTYAEHAMAFPHASWFDIYGDTRDQAYGGVAGESAASTAAVRATDQEVLETSGGSPILAQFSAADGGWTSAGGASYLPAQRDPYDGLIANSSHAWTTTVSAAAVESLAPSIGKLKDLEVTGRNGDGIWGGRVTGIRLIGSAGSATVDPTTFEFDLGLRSTWWRPTPTPAAPRGITATASGKTVTVTWKPPSSVSGSAAVTGYLVKLSPSGKHRTVAASARTVSIGKLTPGTRYIVTVVARSAAGNGPAGKTSVTP
ncbi:MAG TPA: SpoIID/LytB domain-containing protein [Mycobacteriales bacterium]|nr:SpoIID/LytB domain-containing protein [Mycobacteriales bacterium]